MTISRLCAILFALGLLAAVGAFIAGGVCHVWDLRSFGFVAGLPWLIALATRPPGVLLDALRGALARDAADLPPAARASCADVLRGLAGQSLAAGVLVLFGGAMRHLASVAHASGSITVADLVAPFGGLLLAPVYGLVLAAFVYGPLAGSLAGPAGRLAEYRD